MDTSSQQVSRQLEAALSAIDATLTDNEIGGAMEHAGYSSDSIQGGRQLYETAITAASNCSTAKDDLRDAQRRCDDAKAVAKNAISSFYDMAKASFGNGVLNSLRLTGPRLFSATNFTSDALTAFDAAIKLPALQAPLLAKGYDQARLYAERMKITDNATLIQALPTVKNAYKTASIQQRQSLHALQVWLAEFLQKAETVFGERPHLLEKLGRGTQVRSNALEAG